MVILTCHKNFYNSTVLPDQGWFLALAANAKQLNDLFLDLIACDKIFLNKAIAMYYFHMHFYW